MTVETDFPQNSTTAWLSLRRGSYRWDLAPIAADWLNVDGELPLADWLASETAEVIKTGPHRTVYRLTLPEGNFYLKEYKTPDWQAVLQNLVRPCKADLESRAARTAAGLGLNTFETVAVGRRRQFGVVWENFLISREIPIAEPLDRFVLETFPRLSAKTQLIARRSIARELGRIAALLHQNNLLHRDLHPGNLLIETRGDFGKISLIDLHAMSRKPRLSPKEIARNLSLLNNFFYRLSSRTDRLRFLKSYLEHQNATASSLRETAPFFGQVCAAELAKADRRGDKKWRRGNRRLLILENAPNRCRGLAEVGKAQLKRFRDQPEQLFEKSHFIGWRKQTAGLREGLLELPVQGERRPAILTVRPQDGSARSSWEMGHALLRRRLPAPQPLFFVETNAGPWDYLVVEQIPTASSLKRWILEQKIRPGHPADEHRLKEVIEDVANLLKRLHDNGFHQPRFTLSSILVSEEQGERKLWLAGPETIQQPREINARLVIQSLAAFLQSIPAEIRITKAECLRFLRGCLGGEFSRRWKSTWRSVAAVSRNAESKEAA